MSTPARVSQIFISHSLRDKKYAREIKSEILRVARSRAVRARFPGARTLVDDSVFLDSDNYAPGSAAAAEAFASFNLRASAADVMVVVVPDGGPATDSAIPGEILAFLTGVILQQRGALPPSALEPTEVARASERRGRVVLADPPSFLRWYKGRCEGLGAMCEVGCLAPVMAGEEARLRREDAWPRNVAVTALGRLWGVAPSRVLSTDEVSRRRWTLLAVAIATAALSFIAVLSYFAYAGWRDARAGRAAAEAARLAAVEAYTDAGLAMEQAKQEKAIADGIAGEAREARRNAEAATQEALKSEARAALNEQTAKDEAANAAKSEADALARATQLRETLAAYQGGESEIVKDLLSSMVYAAEAELAEVRSSPTTTLDNERAAYAEEPMSSASRIRLLTFLQARAPRRTSHDRLPGARFTWRDETKAIYQAGKFRVTPRDLPTLSFAGVMSYAYLKPKFLTRDGIHGTGESSKFPDANLKPAVITPLGVSFLAVDPSHSNRIRERGARTAVSIRCWEMSAMVGAVEILGISPDSSTMVVRHGGGLAFVDYKPKAPLSTTPSACDQLPSHPPSCAHPAAGAPAGRRASGPQLQRLQEDRRDLRLVGRGLHEREAKPRCVQLSGI